MAAGSGTVAFSDLYGSKTPGRDVSRNEIQPVAGASGSVPTSGKTPAMFWVGMVASLVLLRFAWEKAK